MLFDVKQEAVRGEERYDVQWKSFRDILEEREQQGGKQYFRIFKEILDKEQKSLLSQLGKDKRNSYTGYPHTSGVENNLDHAVPYSLKQQFSNTEIFILLTSVLLHDIGKIKNPKDHHRYSCLEIQKNWSHIGIPEETMLWISVIICSHGWKESFPINNCGLSNGNKCLILCNPNKNKSIAYSELKTIPNASDGPVRLSWLAALLRLSDEVDNQASRTIPSWFRKSKDYSWRSLITDVVFDIPGNCIKLRSMGLKSRYGWKIRKIKKGRNIVELNDVLFLKTALKNINTVLSSNWKEPLQEMGLYYKEAFCEVMLPNPAIISEKDIDPSDKRKNFIKGTSIESSLESGPIVDEVRKAIIRLDKGVISTKHEPFFHWDALVEEAGIDDIELVRLAAKRLSFISENPIKPSINGHEITDVPGLICSNSGWRVKHEKMILTKKRLGDFKPEDSSISTGMGILNRLLSPEIIKSENGGGFYFPYQNGGSQNGKLAPIIAIHGTTGMGKSTLAMQIAVNSIFYKANIPDHWTSVYYSLELQPSNVLQHLEGYNYFQKDDDERDKLKKYIINLEETPWCTLDGDLSNKLLLPRLTKNHSKLSPEILFERKFEELKQAVDWLKLKGFRPFFIIDSLTALIGQPLTRSQIDRLFTFFRSATTPLIVTIEAHKHWALQEEEAIFDAARYLADTVISLSAEEKERYYRQTIEVQKTRYNRRILGKHLLKIKSQNQNATKGFDDRVGIVVYPSIDQHLVTSRGSKNKEHEENGKIGFTIHHDLLPIGSMENGKHKIDSNTCIAISGAMGGHKFALGVNILLATETLQYFKAADPNTLILSFAEEREIRLENVALLEELDQYKDRLILKPTERSPERKLTQQLGEYITLINFRLGKIMPEEFLYIFEKYLKDREGKIKNILFTDTSHLRTRFPLLNSEPLFIPAMVDIIKSRNIFSVFIDVADKGESTQSLLSAVDCRIMLEKEKDKDKEYNTIRVDNVRCKDYDRNPRKIEVVNGGGLKYHLKLSKPESPEN